MERIVGDWDTTVRLTKEEAVKICRFGTGSTCCAFLTVAGKNGFECVRMNGNFSPTILNRLEKGNMNAKGEGGWKGCAWEKEIGTPAEERQASV